MVIDS